MGYDWLFPGDGARGDGLMLLGGTMNRIFQNIGGHRGLRSLGWRSVLLFACACGTQTPPSAEGTPWGYQSEALRSGWHFVTAEDEETRKALAEVNPSRWVSFEVGPQDQAGSVTPRDMWVFLAPLGQTPDASSLEPPSTHATVAGTPFRSAAGEPQGGAAGSEATETSIVDKGVGTRRSVLPPTDLIAWATAQSVKLSWTPPHQRRDGTFVPEDAALRYRIFQDGAWVGTTDVPFYHGAAPDAPGRYRFHVVAVLSDQSAQGSLSRSSQSVELDVGAGEAVFSPGAFEWAQMVPKSEDGILPAIDFSQDRGQTVTHLAFVVRGKGDRPDAIHYRRSLGHAGADTWTSSADAVVQSEGMGTIREVTLAAEGERVHLVWIEANGDSGGFHIRAVKSTDGGQSFNKEVRSVRQSQAWKRDLDSAIDKNSDHHLVWTEASKVYYFKNFEGEQDKNGRLLPVFDRQKRWVNQDQVVYQHITNAPCKDGRSSPCCTASYDDRYSLGSDPKDGQACGGDPACQKELFGAYFERVEEAYMETPSLEVSNDRVTIIARQTRLFDNFPYPNRSWAGLEGQSGFPFFGPPVPDPEWKESHQVWCEAGSKRYQMGFRKAWTKDQYACPLSVFADRDVRLAKDAVPTHPVRRMHKAEFYSYDESHGHPPHWYQWKSLGLWHETDVIKVAQRPLKAGAWSKERVEVRPVPSLRVSSTESKVVLEEAEQTVEFGFRQGAWQRSPMGEARTTNPNDAAFEETLTRWRIGIVDRFDARREGEGRACNQPDAPRASGSAGPAYPKVTSSGEISYAVYEKGSSVDANQSGNNPIHLAYSSDGGQHWNPVDGPIAHGYQPNPVLTASKELLVLYYQPSNDHKSPSGVPLGRIQVARSQDGLNFEHDVISQNDDEHAGAPVYGAALPIHWATDGRQSGEYLGVPTLHANGNFVLAAWVQYPTRASGMPAIVTARATAKDAPEAVATEVILSTPEEITANQSFAAEIACVNAYGMRTVGCDVRSLQLNYGATRFGSLAQVVDDGQYLNGAQVVHLPLRGDGGAGDFAQIRPNSDRQVDAPPQRTGTNLHESGTRAHLADAAVQGTGTPAQLAGGYVLARPQARVLQDNADGNHQKATRIRDALYDPISGFIREYQADSSNPDSQYLADYGRSWAYTQGIFLAQLTRHNDPRAVTVAQRLCEKAHMSPDGEVLEGWPFSWNTDGDAWEDIRLVTGANAWAIHGLGVYLSSPTYGFAPRSEIATCYQKALAGLVQHRAALTPEPSDAQELKAAWLMTAGTTSLGLQNARNPSQLPLGEPWASWAVSREWAYYDILDLVGYRHLNENGSLTSFVRNAEDQPAGHQVHVVAKDSSAFLDLLKTQDKAENVVTEHNLDVLSVLNHALNHWDAIQAVSPKNDLTGLDQDTLLRWRDGLRHAIFERLWREGDGRFVTGGDFEGGQFMASDLTAIDNCSWLALSVDYKSLSKTHMKRLSRCLRYTIGRFVDDLQSSRGTYRGAFYFTNNFKDPYIEASRDQESLYHLEATTGLILALLTFSDHASELFPEDAQNLRQEAHDLWSEMQRFVRDHGAPYSSISIKNVMTELESSTAAIWYIDVYDYYATQYHNPDQPLQNYVHDVTRGPGTHDHPSPYPLSRMQSWTLDAEQELYKVAISSSSGPNTSGSSRLQLEELALAIMVGVHRGAFANAKAGVDRLYATARERTKGDETVLEFGAGGQGSSYVQTRSQLLALLALGQYLEHGSLDSDQRERGKALFRDVLLGVDTLFLDAKTQRLFSGAGWPTLFGGPGEQGSAAETGEDKVTLPLFPVFTLEDHVLAYFVYAKASVLFGDDRWRKRADTTRTVLVRDFWEESQQNQGAGRGRPLLAVGPFHPPSGSADNAWAAALYQVFAQNSGHLGRAQTCSHLVAQIHRVQGERDPDTELALLWSQRAATLFDSRQEELAWNTFARLTEKSNLSTRTLGWTLFAHNPSDALGLGAGIMFTEEGKSAFDSTASAQLEEAYMDHLAALLVAGTEPYTFDRLVSALARIEFIAETVEHAGQKNAVTPSAWREEYQASFASRLMGTLGQLTNGCAQTGDHNIRRRTNSLGLTCESASHQVRRLLRRRTGRDTPESLRFVMKREDDTFAFAQWARILTQRSAVTSPSRSKTNPRPDPQTPTAYFITALEAYPMVNVPVSESVENFSAVLRQHWTEALNQHQTSSPTPLELAGLNPIGLSNPHDPSYWGTTGFTLRALSATGHAVEANPRPTGHRRPKPTGQVPSDRCPSPAPQSRSAGPQRSQLTETHTPRT